MSGKSPKIAALLAGIEPDGLPPNYAGYFACFNRGLYFEAHDVLEELWLAQGKAGANHAFHKGLIQLAGAFVHLQKNRLRPSVALFNLAEANLRRYPAFHDRLDVVQTLELVAGWRAAIESDGFAINPLGRRPAPELHPLPLSAPAGSTSTAPPR
jgi:Domain of unknown function (DUF309)